MKSDSEEIRQFLRDLANPNKLGRMRAKWAEFSFHFSDIVNAVEILKTERIRCREDLERESALPIDIACSDIISNTNLEVRQSVRLYFRPLTPTQFHMEGIRPKQALSKHSHCPIPIFFLFDSWEILSRDDSRFSDSNLAIFGQSQYLCSTAEELKRFNFGLIFHVGTFSANSRTDIIPHRNAEIVIPRELDLGSLRYICCRSPAEKDTLIHLLPSEVVRKWGSRIVVSPSLYERKWVYLQNANLDSREILFDFSPDVEIAGPFDAIVEVLVGDTLQRYRRREFTALGRVPLVLKESASSYEVKLLLDNHITYAGKYDENLDRIPF